jgi:hypothetical protein
VDGYPRAFVYSVPCDRTRDEVPANRDLREIRIRAPKEGDAFASPLANDASLPVEFQVDAPYDAFRQPDEMVEAWLEVKGDPALAARTRQSFAGDRQWVVRWEGLAAQGVVKIDGAAHDFRVPLQTFRLSETKADVRVRLALPGHGMKAKDAKVTVVLDGEPPKIVRYVPPPGPVAKGADIPVSLELSDLSGIDRVLFGFVKNEAALLDEKEKLAEIPSAVLAEKRELEFAVPTKEAKPELIPGQKYLLAVRVWDRVGHSSQEVKPITIEKTAPPPPPPTMGTIEGQVLRRGNLYDNWTSFTVKLLKDGRQIDQVKGRENGRFEFKDVPPGSYTIEAEGFALDPLKGSSRVQVTGGPSSVRIDAQPK